MIMDGKWLHDSDSLTYQLSYPQSRDAIASKSINDTGHGLVSHNKKYHDNLICHICGFESQAVVWRGNKLFLF